MGLADGERRSQPLAVCNTGTAEHCPTACSVGAALHRWQGRQPASCWTSPSGVAVRPQLGLEVERHLLARVLAGLLALHPKALATGACRMQASAYIVAMGGCDCGRQVCMSSGSALYMAEATARHFAGPL